MTLVIPTPFPPVRTMPLKPGSRVDRIHERQFKPKEFNPGMGGKTRFAPLKSPSSGIVGTMYGADDLDCAIFETLLHDIPLGCGPTTLGWSRIENQDHSELIAKEGILLAQLN